MSIIKGFHLPVLTIIVYYVASGSCHESQQYYVAEYGSDDQLCGNINNPCGTLYFVSLCIQNSTHSEFAIKIIDGQSKTEIAYYQLQNTNKYDPCLPIPFDSTKQISIEFIKEQKMDDWFPNDICNQNNGKYLNKFIFEGGYSLIISNWNVTNYSLHSDNSYGLISNFNHFPTVVMCNNCIFGNISSNKSGPYGLLHVSSSIYLFNVTFININAGGDDYNIINAEPFSSEFQEIIFEETRFINVSSKQAILHMTGPGLLRISGCMFENISTSVIISDITSNANITISNSEINVHSGSIYISHHTFSSYIFINNLRITATERILDVDRLSLLQFSANDIANIYNMDMKYLYDLNSKTACVMALTQNMSNYGINVTCSAILCSNPVSIINNFGEMNIDYFTIHVSLASNSTNKWLPTTNHSFNMYLWYTNEENGALITNQGNMNLSNLFMAGRSVSNSVIWNTGVLSVFNFTYDSPDQNVLQAGNIIHQSGTDPSLFIHESHFIGSYFQVVLTTGAAAIYNSTFEHSTIAVSIDSMDRFMMDSCKIRNNGRFYGTCGQQIRSYTAGMQLSSSSNIVLSNNIFSGYDPHGLLVVESSAHISLVENTFQINAEQLFYDVPEKKFILGVVSITSCSNSAVVDNQFEDNVLDLTVPWIMYVQNQAVNCLYGNIFTYWAFEAFSTNITSCLRPQLVQYTSTDHVTSQIYGHIERSLFKQSRSSTIIFDIDQAFAAGLPVFPVIISFTNNSYVALDNINIIVTNTYNVSWPFPYGNLPAIVGNDGNLLLLDSYITVIGKVRDDILNNFDICNIICNDRLAYDTSAISKLLFHCGSVDLYDSNKLAGTMHSVNTKYVNHLSITKINFTTNDDLYYPGQILNFAYKFMDIHNNVIEYNPSNEIYIQLIRETLSLTLTIEKNACPICDNGVVLYDASLDHNVGDDYNMTVSIMDDILIPEHSILSLTIIGCLIGYGATLNKDQCELCPFGTYSLLPNNTNECLSCNQSTIKVSQCDGFYHFNINGFDYKYLYFLLLLFIPVIMSCIIGMYCKQQYDKAFVVDEALVLIIGISQFDDLTAFLPGVKKNIDDLVGLWRDKYNYDVFVCNSKTLYSTKQDVIDFIDSHKTTIEEKIYRCIIVHIVSHGNEDAFICSDGKQLYMEFISHELTCTTAFSDNSRVIKLIFNHGCRGTADYSIGDISLSRTKNEQPPKEASFNIHAAINSTNHEVGVSDASNLVIISGTIEGRAMSDSGEFTKCICESFAKNLQRKMKADFHALVAEIGTNLEKRTNRSEICNMNGTMRFNPVRFEKCKNKETIVTQCDENQIEMHLMHGSKHKVISRDCEMMEVLLND